MRAAQAEWKTCVDRAGYTFAGSSWDDLLTEYMTRWDQLDRANTGAVAAFREEEIAVATVATDCAVPMWKVLRNGRRSVVEALEPELAVAIFD